MQATYNPELGEVAGHIEYFCFSFCFSNGHFLFLTLRGAPSAWKGSLSIVERYHDECWKSYAALPCGFCTYKSTLDHKTQPVITITNI